MLIAPVVILSQPGTGVEVAVGVKVIVGVKVVVGVKVCVKVGVTVGVSVGVLLGRGVNVITGPDGSVAVGVSDVTVTVGVLAATVAVGPPDGDVAVGGFEAPDVGTTLCPVVISIIPSIVRALDEVIVREPIGIRFTMGLYVAVTVTSTRSRSGPEFTTTPVSTLPEQVSNDPVPGPWS
jgi:hypothetical protein